MSHSNAVSLVLVFLLEILVVGTIEYFNCFYKWKKGQTISPTRIFNVCAGLLLSIAIMTITVYILTKPSVEIN